MNASNNDGKYDPGFDKILRQVAQETGSDFILEYTEALRANRNPPAELPQSVAALKQKFDVSVYAVQSERTSTWGLGISDNFRSVLGGITVPPEITELNLFVSRDCGFPLHDDDIAMISEIKSLECLKLCVEIDTISEEGLLPLSELPDLSALHCTGFSNLSSHLHSISNIRGLRALELSPYSPVQPQDFKSIGQLSGLEKLIFNCGNSSGLDFSVLCTLNSLKKICLEDSSLSDADSVFLENMPELEHANLSGTNVGLETVKRLSDKHLLKNLYLSDCVNIIPDALIHLDRLKSLETLMVDSRNVNADVARALAKLDKLSFLVSTGKPIDKSVRRLLKKLNKQLIVD